MRFLSLIAVLMFLAFVSTGTTSASVITTEPDSSDETTAIANQATSPITFSGSNDQATQAFYCGVGRLDVSWTAGEGHFSIWLVDASGEEIDLLANQVNRGAGSSVTHIASPGYYLLKISASSPWTVTLPTTLQTTTANSFSGSNDQTTPAFYCNVGRLNVEWTAGKGHFSIWLVDASGEEIDLLANQVDRGAGSSVVHIASPGYYLLKISASSPWTVTLPTTLQTTTANSFSGSNDQVTPALSLTPGRLDVSWTAGEGHFSIWLVDASGEGIDLIANQVNRGAGSSVTHIPISGYYMLMVSASSPWTVTLPTLQPAPVVTTPLPVVSPPTQPPVVVPPVVVPPVVVPTTTTIQPVVTTTLQPVSQPVAQPVVTLNPASSWGKRYAVGDPGTYLGSRAGSSTAPAGTGKRRIEATTGTVLKPGSKSYGITPPGAGSFVRWYPAARWAAGIK